MNVLTRSYKMENIAEDIDWEMALKRIQISQIVASTILKSGDQNLLENCRREDGSLHMKDIIKLEDVKRFLDVFVEMSDEVSPEDAEGLEEAIHAMMWMKSPGKVDEQT